MGGRRGGEEGAEACVRERREENGEWEGRHGGKEGRREDREKKGREGEEKKELWAGYVGKGKGKREDSEEGGKEGEMLEGKGEGGDIRVLGRKGKTKAKRGKVEICVVQVKGEERKGDHRVLEKAGTKGEKLSGIGDRVG